MIAFLRDDNYSPHFNRTKKIHLKLQSIPYALVDVILFKRDLNGVLQRCIHGDQTNRLLKEFHNGPSARTTTIKIIRANYYWPYLFGDAHKWVRKCKCALFVGK